MERVYMVWKSDQIHKYDSALSIIMFCLHMYYQEYYQFRNVMDESQIFYAAYVGLVHDISAHLIMVTLVRAGTLMV